MDAISIHKLGLDSEDLEKPIGVYLECPYGQHSPNKDCKGCQYLIETNPRTPKSRHLSKSFDENPTGFVTLICDLLRMEKTYKINVSESA